MRDTQPRILFLSLSDDAGSERIVSEMSRRGARCSVMARAGSVVVCPIGVVSRFVLPGWAGPLTAAFGMARRLRTATKACGADVVIPLDDFAAGLLCDIVLAAGSDLDLKALLTRSLGDPAHYRTSCSRDLLIEAARAIGIRTPTQARAADLTEARAAAASIGFPLMLKREATCGGAGVIPLSDECDLVAAFGRATRRAKAKRAGRRLLGFRSARNGSPITLQVHVTGRLALRTVACQQGRVLACVTFAADRLNPPVTGSSTVVQPIAHPEIETAASRLVAALGCSGFVSFDFIMAEEGLAYLIEMNARPVGSGHLGALFGCDLYGAYLSQFQGFRDATPSTPGAHALRKVALFPKEMLRDPDSPDLMPDAHVLHDVPWHEPAVVEQYGAMLVKHHFQEADSIRRCLRLSRLPEHPAIQSEVLRPEPTSANLS